MISTSEEHRAQLQRIQALQLRLEGEGIETENLDSLVHDCASEKASEVNGAGMPAQLSYLLTGGCTPEDIINRARMAKEEDE